MNNYILAINKPKYILVKKSLIKQEPILEPSQIPIQEPNQIPIQEPKQIPIQELKQKLKQKPIQKPKEESNNKIFKYDREMYDNFLFI
jgi:hypothetical protein